MSNDNCLVEYKIVVLTDIVVVESKVDRLPSNKFYELMNFLEKAHELQTLKIETENGFAFVCSELLQKSVIEIDVLGTMGEEYAK